MNHSINDFRARRAQSKDSIAQRDNKTLTSSISARNHQGEWSLYKRITYE